MSEAMDEPTYVVERVFDGSGTRWYVGEPKRSLEAGREELSRCLRSFGEDIGRLRLVKLRRVAVVPR
jgi:hypothetical protein